MVDSKEDEEWTCSDEIGGGGGEELNAIITHDNIEEELKPNLNHVIDNIQIEPILSVKTVVSIVELTQHVGVVI